MLTVGLRLRGRCDFLLNRLLEHFFLYWAIETKERRRTNVLLTVLRFTWVYCSSDLEPYAKNNGPEMSFNWGWSINSRCSAVNCIRRIEPSSTITSLKRSPSWVLAAHRPMGVSLSCPFLPSSTYSFRTPGKPRTGNQKHRFNWAFVRNTEQTLSVHTPDWSSGYPPLWASLRTGFTRQVPHIGIVACFYRTLIIPALDPKVTI